MNHDTCFLLPVIPFYPQVMVKGEGSYVFDTTGKRYLDLNAGQFCSVLGNNNPDFIRYLQSNVSTLTHTNTEILTEEVLSAAKNINRISGELNGYSIFLSTGAECVEFCLRFAKQIKQRNGIVCFSKGYHGLTLGAQSVTFGGTYAKPHIPDVYEVTIPSNNSNIQDIEKHVKLVEEIFSEHKGEIAAVLFEPIVSVGGMLFPPVSYFQRIRKLCDEYDVLLLFDECQTGFGRCGSWFYYQQLGIIPDMVACAKAAGLGYPVSFAMFQGELVQQAYPITHYSSHQNDGFAGMLINFGIEYMEKNNLLESIKDKGAYFLNELKKLADKCGHFISPRGCGLMLGIDIAQDGITDSRQFFRRLSDEAMEQGLILQGTDRGRTLRFLPNYLITREEIDFCIGVLYDVMCRLNFSEK